LFQALVLDLADPLAGDVEGAAELVGGVVGRGEVSCGVVVVGEDRVAVGEELFVVR